MTRPRFNRILLKLSGEVLMGSGQFGIDPAMCDRVAREIKAARGEGHEVCVVVGGGIIGSSVAYHLAKLGWTDTVVVERGQLTCGSTFHAAGLVGQLRSSANITQLLKYSVELW